MATLELGTLSEHLENDQVKAVQRALNESGAPGLAVDDHAEAIVLDRDLDDDVLVDFFDRLDANDASADIYLPVDFEEVIEVDGMRVGSAHSLILVLESLKEDFFVEEEEDEEEEEEEAEYEEDEEEDGAELFEADEDEVEVKDDRLRRIWHVMHKGAKTSVRKNLCLFVRT
ncbi:MAG TPA: hypothetical protein VNO33_22880 [Kofleriaceae bacterium]|nr:hypothetical protein [Kofleriaceae bacterium]